MHGSHNSIAMRKTIYHTELSAIENTNDAICAAVLANPEFEPFAFNGIRIIGQCVSCRTWLVDPDWALRTQSGKVYCGTCFVPDEGEILRQYGTTREGAHTCKKQ